MPPSQSTRSSGATAARRGFHANGDLERPALAKLRQVHRRERRSIRSEVRSWYQVYEPIDLDFQSVWRRVPAILKALRDLDGLDDVDDRPLQVIAWIGSALPASATPSSRRQQDAYVRARERLRRAAAQVEAVQDCIGTLSPKTSLELLEAREQLRKCSQTLVEELGQLDPVGRWIGRFQPEGDDLFSFLVMRILVEAVGLTKARAEVVVARMGDVFGWNVDYETRDSGGRDESPAIRKRVERFKNSGRWEVCAPWQVLLWDTLGVSPDRPGANAAPPISRLDCKRLADLSRPIDSEERYMDVAGVGASIQARIRDIDRADRGFKRESAQLQGEARDRESRILGYEEKLLHLTRQDPIHAVILEKLEAHYADSKRQYEQIRQAHRAASRALGRPTDDADTSALPTLGIAWVELLVDGIRQDPEPTAKGLKDLARWWTSEKTEIEKVTRRLRVLLLALGRPGDEINAPVYHTFLTADISPR